jgi:hypothetical protein
MLRFFEKNENSIKLMLHGVFLILLSFSKLFYVRKLSRYSPFQNLNYKVLKAKWL